MPWVENAEMYGPGGGDYVDELGNTTPDPFGAVAPVPAPAAGFVPVPVIDPSVRPNVQPVPGSEAVVGDSYRAAGTLPGLGAPVPNGAPPDLRPGQGNTPGGSPALPPDLSPGQGNQPAMVPVTTSSSESSTSTTGIDKAGQAAIGSATDKANAAAQSAGNAEVGNINAAVDLQRKQAQDAYGRGVNSYFTDAAAVALQDSIAMETDAKLQEAAKFKPDRTALFRGDTGLLFGISAAISAMAGGWLMGQGLTGGKNPYLDVVFKMIDDDANDQINQNSATMQQLTRILGDAKAAGKELKARMLSSVNETLAAQAKFQDADLVQRGTAVVQAKVEAEQAKNAMDAAKLTAQTVTKSHQTRSQTQMVANPALTQGFDLNDPKVVSIVGKVGALENLAAEAKGLAANGVLADSVGPWDSTINAVTPDTLKSGNTQRVDALREKWELLQRENWKSEPNGEAAQARLSSISFPKNDAGIPLFLQNVQEVLNTVDPGGRYRTVSRGLGRRPQTAETGNRTPIVR